MFETAFALGLTQFARSLSFPERLSQRPVRNAALEPWRLRNTGMDALYYDVKALTADETFYISDSLASEGLIMIVPPTGAGMLTLCDSVEEFRLRGGREVRAMAVAGIGGSAIGAAAFHGFVAPASQVPLIGASGAIAGVVSAYLLLHPRVKIWVLAFARIPLRLPAWVVLTLWISFQLFMFLVGGEEQVSWACHIGGIVTGAVLLPLLKRRGVPLFDREVVTPRAALVEQTSAVRPMTHAPPPRWGRQ